MKLKFRLYILGFLDLLLSAGAVWLGGEMLRAGRGNIMGPSHQWLFVLPVQDWFISGLLVILIFGIGNMAASLLCFLKKNRLAWCLSAAMGGILYLTMITLVLVTGNWNLAIAGSFASSIAQLFISRSVYLEQKKRASGYSRSHSYINTGYF